MKPTRDGWYLWRDEILGRPTGEWFPAYVSFKATLYMPWGGPRKHMSGSIDDQWGPEIQMPDAEPREPIKVDSTSTDHVAGTTEAVCPHCSNHLVVRYGFF